MKIFYENPSKKLEYCELKVPAILGRRSSAGECLLWCNVWLGVG
jgi:hypothetical protein